MQTFLFYNFKKKKSKIKRPSLKNATSKEFPGII